MDAIEPVLREFGVEPQHVAAAAARVTAAAPTVAATLADRLAAAPDPALALASWERLLDVTVDPSVLATLAPAEAAALFTLLGGSQSLVNTLCAAGAGWLPLFRASLSAPLRAPADHVAAVAGALDAPWDEFAERLRQVRHHEYLRIGLADLTGRATVEVTVAELSALAAGLFAAAQRWAERTLARDYGGVRATADEAAGAAAASAFVVLGLGKLGGGELNFSSDVDVMYLYATDAARSAGGRRGRLDARQYFTRMAELITRALQEMTPSGFAFRVDLRLRPDGINGPIVNPLANALLYYEAYGQTWERTALIQARPVAGDGALGDRFLREVRPFVYRRYLDYATVADMKEMKARVEAELGAKAGRGNVKLGRGGIREIEFLVQVLQLIHGGRDERLRGGGSLPTLARLTAGGYLPPDEGAALADAYRFLRNVEHKIQILQQRQTHRVPAEHRAQATLARRLGYRAADVVQALWSDLDRHTALVRRAFEKLFYEPSAETRRTGDASAVELLEGLDQRVESLDRIRRLGFAAVEPGYENLRLLRDGPRTARARAGRRKVLYEIAPALLATILKSADPDLALQNLATFVSSVGARTSFLALLRENPGTMRMLVDLFGGSQFLANAFIRHPELLDTLVRADLVRVHREPGDLRAELAGALVPAADIEEKLDVLRRFRNQEFLRIGINDLQRLLDPEEVSREITALAEACLDAAGTIAARAVCDRYGWRQLPGRAAILGMGKLGSGELNYNSDLDLIFVYAEDPARAPPGTSAHEAFSKFAQRLITVLQVPTREGIVYRIDTRLRPSGRSGPLVSSLDGFRRYHETSAQVWERQALIKARVVAGDAALAAAVDAIVAGFVYRAPLTAAEAQEIRRLRQRMERELAHESADRLNVKTGRGGLVDVEFLAQMLQLHYGAAVPRVRVRATLPALDALAGAGVLPPADHTLLVDGYRFLRRVGNALRLAHDRPVEEFDRTVDLTAVARRMGTGGDAKAAGDALWQEYQVRRESIRACYERWFERAEAGQLPAPAPDAAAPRAH